MFVSNIFPIFVESIILNEILFIVLLQNNDLKQWIMKKRVFFKWIFCLLGGVMFFACSKDYKGLVEVDNSIENIQIKNGMLVFYTYVLYAQPFFLCWI